MIRAIAKRHPYRIDCEPGLHIRFSNLTAAIDTAMFIGKWIYDEREGKLIDPRNPHYAAS